MRLLLKSLTSQVLVLLIMFSLIVVGCTTNLSILKKKDSYVPNEEQNLVSNGDIELLNNGAPVDWNCNVTLPTPKQNKSTVASPGFQSDHALIMPANGSNSHSMWNARLNYQLHPVGVCTKGVFGFDERVPTPRGWFCLPAHYTPLLSI